ncbi:MAG: hypothetical protein KAX18_02670 [Candidatus Lokiarchaeota archaeon]|nr:hypothetical protein [Candidatus Lokiarchaeota archaeon]
MIEKKTCTYCGWEFPTGFLQLITENTELVFCENCGTEIINENNVSDTTKSEENPTQNLKVEKTNKKKIILNHIYEKVRREKSPVNRVLMVSDFTKIFKDNFKIVISRIIYSHIRAFEINSAIVIKSVELTEEILDNLYEEISPVLTKRIKREYLGNLHKSSIKDFEKWFEKLQSKLKLNKRFHQDFIIYLRRLIKEVYIIVSELWDEKYLQKFEGIIRDDLKNFSSNDRSSSYKEVQKNQKKDDLFCFPNQTLEEDKMAEIPKNQLIELKSDIPGGKRIFSELSEEYILVKDKVELNGNLEPPPDEPDLANKWFTDSLKVTMLNFDFLRKHASFRRMSSFFGLTKSYLYDIRYKKTIISHEYLDQMKSSLSERVKNLKKIRSLKSIEAQDTLFSIIQFYRQKYNPKITANTQIDKNLKQNYFFKITKIEKAFYLGLLFADGWISIQRSKIRESYRIGLALKVEDKETVENFATAIGLSKDRVKTRDVIDSKTGKRYKMAYLYIGVESTSVKHTMGYDLIKHGMVYRLNEKTGRRYKVPILPIFCERNGQIHMNLMLAFLLGYYNGDGTLKDNKYPIIYSSNREFLEAISKVFSLGIVRKTEREVIDFETNEVNQKILYSLSISQIVFKEMMSLQLNSMRRKSIAAENIILDKPVMTRNRIWLIDILPKDFLVRILDTHSPSTIAKLIGIDHNTMIKFIDFVYKIPRKDKGYYIKLSSDRKREAETSELNQLYNQLTRLLIIIGNSNPFK